MKVTFTESQVQFLINVLNVAKEVYLHDYRNAIENDTPRMAVHFLRQAAEACSMIEYLESH